MRGFGSLVSQENSQEEREEPDPQQFFGVKLSIRAFLRFLSSHVVSTSTIACKSSFSFLSDTTSVSSNPSFFIFTSGTEKKRSDKLYYFIALYDIVTKREEKKRERIIGIKHQMWEITSVYRMNTITCLKSAGIN